MATRTASILAAQAQLDRDDAEYDRLIGIGARDPEHPNHAEYLRAMRAAEASYGSLAELTYGTE